MLLLVDAGNTRIKWAVVDASLQESDDLARWSASGSVGHDDLASLAREWTGWAISRALVSNVAGIELHDKLQQVLLQACGPVAVEWFASVPALAGVRNGYRHPMQLGCDRFASAIGAHTLFPSQSLIVATCGTATTIDAVTADGLFMGGMILPGLGLMATSLANNTAQLPCVAQSSALKLFADNTEDAIISGCLAAQVGAIEYAVAVHSQHGPVKCVLAGGAASLIGPVLPVEHKHVENLVLIGLHAVAMSLFKRGA